MPVALGFIETNSLIGAAEASNVMARTSNIILLGKEVLSSGLITVKIVGDEESVETAINSATEALKNLERNISSHIIIEPDEQVFSVLPEMRSLYFSLKKTSKRKIKKTGTEKIKVETEKIKAETEKPIAVTRKLKVKTEKPKVKAKKLKVKPPKQKVKTKKHKVRTEKQKVRTEKQKVRTEKQKVRTKTQKVKTEKPKIEAVETALEKAGAEIKEIEKPEIEKKEPEAEKVLTNEKSLKENEDIFIVHLPEKRLRTKSINKITEEKIPEIKESKRISYRNDTIERLRREALGLNKSEKKKPVKKEIKKIKVNKNENKNDKNNLRSMNVHQLRKLARSRKNFPIQGREISKANRKILLEYFNSMK